MAQKKNKKGIIAVVVIVLLVALGWGGFKGYQWWAQNNLPVEEKAKDFADMIIAHQDNEAELEKVIAEIDAYYEKLSDEEQDKFDDAMEAYMTGKMGAPSAIDSVAMEMAAKMVQNQNNEAEFSKVMAEIDAYYDSLSEADQPVFEKALQTALAALMSADI